MPISDSIQAEMQKVNALFGEAVVKGRNFAALDQLYTVVASHTRAQTSSRPREHQGFGKPLSRAERTGCEACLSQHSPCRHWRH
jgi:hypothetical protein